jgi:hypothetical protein
VRLKISRDLSLPPEAVTQTFAILAKRGAGKTYTAAVMVEEFVKAGLPVVVADPVGVWWGLRSSADGKEPGLPVHILGGERGDVPLEQTAGQVIADVVVDARAPLVLDLSLFRKGETIRFMTDFAERLYQRNREPLHLVLDEADVFCPQRPRPETARMVGAVEDLVRRGRARGIGVTMITQRPAVLNKDVLTQAEVLVTLRMTGPQDRDAIDAWVDLHGSKDERDALKEALPSLPIGTAWFWSPGWLDVFKPVRIRERETFDSSRTPKAGERKVEPKAFAAIDLEALGEQIRATVEKAKAEDPRALQKRILDLERELAKPTAETKVETVVERVEVPVFNGEVTKLAEIVEHLRAFGPELRAATDAIAGAVDRAGSIAKRSQVPRERGEQKRGTTAVQPSPPGRSVETVSRPPARRPAPAAFDEDVQLKAGARRILETFARHYPMTMTKAQLGTLARFKITGGTFQTYFSQLKRLRLIQDVAGELSITETGLNYIGEVPTEPQTTEELLAMWRGALKAGARAMLDVLVSQYPSSLTKEDLAETVAMTVTGGTFQTYLSTLRRNGLVEVEGSEVRASDTLFLSGVPA